MKIIKAILNIIFGRDWMGDFDSEYDADLFSYEESDTDVDNAV